jgi:SAM-dependent methyltransferase
MWIEALLRRLPRALRRSFRTVLYLPIDLRDALTGRRDPLVPPRGASAVGEGEFRTVGEEFLRHFREIGGLEPGHRVLDVGCGIGRMAVPLTGYLDSHGSYEGFDVSREGIAWCRRAISRRFSRFRFLHADVANSEYNPGGRIAPGGFRFPYPDASFDFVIATSVFTHLLPDAAARYLAEICRVLAPGGRAFATAFLLSVEARDAINRSGTSYRFTSAIPGAFIHDTAAPESAVAYEEAEFLRLLRDAGLSLRGDFHRGTWPGRSGPSFQDIVVADRRPGPKAGEGREG